MILPKLDLPIVRQLQGGNLYTTSGVLSLPDFADITLHIPDSGVNLLYRVWRLGLPV